MKNTKIKNNKIGNLQYIQENMGMLMIHNIIYIQIIIVTLVNKHMEVI